MNYMKNLNHYGDLLAIPFFALSFYYFYTIPYRTILENILMLFSLAGFILDCLFSAQFFM